ncbi:hydroxypyruvate isomerase [Stappia stellulata]|uniref:hydroxypyruvate isomerase n=1 Tax=Stappia stellulata TaxID=71235 RepID=UPI0003FDB960|nr:hydroxypyruvate isomerase [Stappia stellulata]
MPKFAANLSMLFTEVDFLERFDAAADAGFSGVEFQFPYAHEMGDLQERLTRCGLTQVLHNLPPGDWDAGERGIAALPDRVDEFRDGVETALRYASVLGCRQLNCLAGIAPEGADPRLLNATLVENLRYAAERLGEVGIRLLVEPINTRDIPGFFLSTSAQALEILDAVGSPNLALQYDIYHMQVMEGDIAHRIREILPRIAHIQFADTPGRHEPGTGELNYPFLFAHLDSIGYDGWVSAEYRPATTTRKGLGWLAEADAGKS